MAIFLIHESLFKAIRKPIQTKSYMLLYKITIYQVYIVQWLFYESNGSKNCFILF